MDRQVGEDAIGGLARDHAAGHAVAEEVIQPVGAEPGQGLFQQRIDRVVVEFGRRVAEPCERPRHVGPVQHQRLEPLVMVLLDR